MTDREKEKMAAEIKGAIRQLESLQDHCERMIDKNDPDNIWEKDVTALSYGIAALKIFFK